MAIHRDTPSIATAAYTSTTFVPNNLGSAGVTSGMANIIQTMRTHDFLKETDPKREWFIEEMRNQMEPKKEKVVVANSSRRIVKVIIVDPDEQVPMEKCILYSGSEKMTDLTDQELFFEIEIKSLLDKHNTFRQSLLNKKVKERTENLEPIKVRDLKMVVVEVAKF